MTLGISVPYMYTLRSTRQPIRIEQSDPKRTDISPRRRISDGQQAPLKRLHLSAIAVGLFRMDTDLLLLSRRHKVKLRRKGVFCKTDKVHPKGQC